MLHIRLIPYDFFKRFSLAEKQSRIGLAKQSRIALGIAVKIDSLVMV
jgi:hypothetical protein